MADRRCQACLHFEIWALNRAFYRKWFDFVFHGFCQSLTVSMIDIDVLKLLIVTFAMIIDWNNVILLDASFLVVVLVVADNKAIILIIAWNMSTHRLFHADFDAHARTNTHTPMTVTCPKDLLSCLQHSLMDKLSSSSSSWYYTLGIHTTTWYTQWV